MLAFDDDLETRWGSDFVDNQWLAVDLGATQRIGRVHLVWEDAYASEYRIEVSDDGQNWRSIYSTTQSEGGEENVSFAPVQTRFARVFCVKRATPFGSSLREFQVRAPK